MRAEIRRQNISTEFETDERCFIVEVANDEGDEEVSISRARVSPGVTTRWHKLENVAERYIIVSGLGLVEVGDLPPTEVGPGDVVRIPPNTAQRVSNAGEVDLLFYCICSPRFTPQCYTAIGD